MQDFRGISPSKILSRRPSDDSTWHFFQALSWLDYATRENAPSAIQYAALELRYGVEYLLFELLVLSSESVTLAEYQKAIGTHNAKQLKKMLDSPGRNYTKLAEFTKIVLSVDADAPKLQFWKIPDLFRYWAVASEFLHFHGPHSLTLLESNWAPKAIARLGSILGDVWSEVTQTIGKGLLKPSGMPAEVYQAWSEFAQGKLNHKDLALRLRIMQPGLQARRGKTGWQWRGRRTLKIRVS
jgi:hypothetical protein